MLKLKLKLAMLTLAASLVAFGASAAPITLTFDDMGLVHGSVVNSQYPGVTISAINTGGGPDLAVAFDSDLSGTRDTDLEFGGGWATGNIAGEQLGNLLIIQENSLGCGSGICSAPDDEGGRPAGTLIFDFAIGVTSFGFDLVDVDSLSTETGSITFFDGGSSTTISMMSFLMGLPIGDNSANRIAPFLVADLDGISQITRVELNLGGSAAVDNVTYEVVPEPATGALVGLGLALLSRVGRSRRA